MQRESSIKCKHDVLKHLLPPTPLIGTMFAFDHLLFMVINTEFHHAGLLIYSLLLMFLDHRFHHLMVSVNFFVFLQSTLLSLVGLFQSPQWPVPIMATVVLFYRFHESLMQEWIQILHWKCFVVSLPILVYFHFHTDWAEFFFSASLFAFCFNDLYF